MKRNDPPKKSHRPDLTRYVPPGYSLDRDLSLFWLSYAGVVLTSIFTFGAQFNEQYHRLFEYVDGQKILDAGEIMPDFVTLLPGVFPVFLLMVPVLLLMTALHYQYFYLGGSKSIYLMRRLPDKWELHRRCLTLPLAGAVIVPLTAAALFLLYYLYYVTSTPPECLTPGQWAKIWSVIP